MIKFLDLRKVNASHGQEIEDAVNETVRSGWYLLGEQNKKFEEEYASYIGTNHAIGCANGLDALTLTFMALMEMGRLKKGDEILVQANTFIASVLAITETGLNPVFVEPDPVGLEIDPSKIEDAITPATRGLLLVHLYGRCAYSPEIEEIVKRHDLILIEDNAQAHGCRYDGRLTGSLGLAGCHSFYPGKNLGALGDGGAVTTDDSALAETIRTLANYGSSRKYIFDYCGRNSRLDEIQAAALRVKLKYLDEDNDKRRDIARIYYENISNPLIQLPPALGCGSNVYHVFPVLTDFRDQLQRYLSELGIQTLIHYPVPPHKQKCYEAYASLSLPVTERLAATELSLPISPVMTRDEALEVSAAVNKFRPVR